MFLLLLLFSLLALSTPLSSPLPTVVVAGASGYIGKQVVKSALLAGHPTIALVRTRPDSNSPLHLYLNGATILPVDYSSPTSLQTSLSPYAASHFISCLASRSGVKKDAYLVDYLATSNFLQAGTAVSAAHFTLLSAFCVKNPWLQFQQAKLKLEGELTAQEKVPYTIVRPTAFFKSVSAQLEIIQKGAPYVMFGDGYLTSCNPIAESDLAKYLVDSMDDTPDSGNSRVNKIINLGGPDSPLSQKKLGEMMFEATGVKEFYVSAPLFLFDVIIDSLQWLADKTGSEKLEDAAETWRM